MTTTSRRARQIVVALEADAAREDRGGDRAYRATVWERGDHVRVYVYEGKVDCGYIDCVGEPDYQPITRGRAAVRLAVERGLSLLSGSV